MDKFKKWLYNKFLPAWCKDDLLDTNAHLVGVVADLRGENQRLQAYISGMENALRRCGRSSNREVRQ